MAADEALLLSVTRPTLRVYSWSEPAVSFGYFIPLADARIVAGPSQPVVRRWTGGGIVSHGTDFTWSLIVPRSHPAASLNPPLSYASFHKALAAALLSAGIAVTQVPPDAPAPSSGQCLDLPAPGDLLTPDGRKIAGAGQRRSRHGLLHQGTLHGVPLPHNFPSRLAAALASEYRTVPADDFPVALCADLTARYQSPDWLEKR
jgi:lipoate-protein ligase A